MVIIAIIAGLAALCLAVACLLQKMANETLIHMMLENGLSVNEGEFKKHAEKCIQQRIKGNDSKGR